MLSLACAGCALESSEYMHMLYMYMFVRVQGGIVGLQGAKSFHSAFRVV
jgi:hypothetical protein